MKFKKIVFFIFALTSIINSQTIIPNNCEIFGKWNKENSPYIIEGQAIVPKGKILSIDPGVIVKFRSSENLNISNFSTTTLNIGYLKVLGTIKAIGTRTDSIIFSRQDTVGFWGIILVNEWGGIGSNSDSSIFSYCRFEYSRYIYDDAKKILFEGAISAYYAINLQILNCTFTNNSRYGFHQYEHYQGKTIIQNNLFSSNQDGGILLKYIEKRSDPPSLHIIDANTFKNNVFAINSSESYVQITNNHIAYGGMRLHDTEGTVDNNIVTNSERAIYLTYASNPRISNNILSENTYGIYFEYYCRYSKLINNLINTCQIGINATWDCSSDISIFNCDFVNCGTGISVRQGSELQCFNSIFWLNKKDYETDNYTNSILNLRNCLLQSIDYNENITDLGGNIINRDPLFIDNTNNFALKLNSPAKNEGTFDTSYLNEIDFDLNNEKRIVNGRIDIGAYECQDSSSFIYIVTPSEKEFYQKGDTLQISWIKSEDISSVDLGYSFDDGKSWTPLISDNYNTRYSWILPEVDTDSGLIKISAKSKANTNDISGAFSIVRNLIKDKAQIYGIWRKDKYTIVGEAIIPEGKKLIIQPGVKIEFKTGHNSFYQSDFFDLSFLRIQGELEAEGTVGDSIIFTRRGNSGNWGVLAFDKVGINDLNCHNLLKYCKIEHAFAITKPFGRFDDPLIGAISIYYSSANIQNCNISQNLLGIFFQRLGNAGIPVPIIRNNYIENNIEGGILCWSNSSPIINGNVLVNNSGYGIRCVEKANPLISNNSIISIGSSDPIPSVTVQFPYDLNCDYLSNKSTKLMKSGVSVLKSEYGIICENESNPTIVNTLIYGNAKDFKISNSSPSISYSLVGESALPNGMVDEGNNIIGIDPQIVREDSVNSLVQSPINYFISMHSPCIDAGRPDTTGLFLAATDILGNDRFFDGDLNSISQIDIGAIEYNGLITKIKQGNVISPTEYVIFQNYPNPFNPTTTIKYYLPINTKVKISIFNIKGQLIIMLVDQEQTPGVYKTIWDASRCSSGIYLMLFETDKFRKSLKLVLTH